MEHEESGLRRHKQREAEVRREVGFLGVGVSGGRPKELVSELGLKGRIGSISIDIKKGGQRLRKYWFKCLNSAQHRKDLPH